MTWFLIKQNGTNFVISLAKTDWKGQKKRSISVEAYVVVNSAKRLCPRRQLLATSNCLFCEESEGKLHQFSTLRANTNVWTIASDRQDASLLAKLEGGDLIALKVKYHLNCLVQIRIGIAHS